MRKLKIAERRDEKENEKEKEQSKPIKIPKTLLAHIEQIIEMGVNSRLDEEFYQKAKRSINFIAKKMKLTVNQSILFAVFVEKSNDTLIYLSEISNFFDCRMVKVIAMQSDFDELERKRLIRCCRDSDKHSFRVPVDVIQSVKQNIAYVPQSTKGLDIKELFKHIDRIFDERVKNEITFKIMHEELKSLLEDNASLLFCKQINEYERMFDEYYSLVILLFFCHRFINRDDDSISYYDWEGLLDEKWEARNLNKQFQNGDFELICNNIIANKNDNGFADMENFQLSSDAKENLFVELDINEQQSTNKKDLILHDSITQKELFYNGKEQAQIKQLSALLSQERFLSVQKKLEDRGMRKGFACLFYGAPGTGKTETVYQMARVTGRDIMMVDISESKSMWYGESEKRIKKIFDTYRTFLKTSKVAPILLFNEADAIIEKRKEMGRGSIDQTQNAMQNILLQEIENLEGIMIATTNLTENLDKAFERRFLYKIEFGKPDIDAKSRIWNTMLPSLSENERLVLAKNYDFSGGQIENIVRKFTVDSILNDANPSIETIHQYCQSEFLYKKNQNRRIGYC